MSSPLELRSSIAALSPISHSSPYIHSFLPTNHFFLLLVPQTLHSARLHLPMYHSELSGTDLVQPKPRLLSLSPASIKLTLALAQAVAQTVSPPSHPFASTIFWPVRHSPGFNIFYSCHGLPCRHRSSQVFITHSSSTTNADLTISTSNNTAAHHWSWPLLPKEISQRFYKVRCNVVLFILCFLRKNINDRTNT